MWRKNAHYRAQVRAVDQLLPKYEAHEMGQNQRPFFGDVEAALRRLIKSLLTSQRGKGIKDR